MKRRGKAVKFHLPPFLPQNMPQMQPVTISAAARELRVDRRTVQRYCRREPGIMVGKKVDLESLRTVIAHCKAADGRGFPLGRGRWPRLALKVPKKEKPIIRRTLNQRLQIIAREFEAMTDAEQVQLLRILPKAIPGLFRLHNLIRATDEGRDSATDSLGGRKSAQRE
jgi:hypothetical protein